MSLTPEFVKSFAIETWTLYGIGVLSVALRLYESYHEMLLIVYAYWSCSTSRIRRLGLLGLESDDYLMLSALVWYTILCVLLNVNASGGGSNLLTEDDIAHLTPETTAERVKGSKVVFASEHAMLLTIWTLKACMLIIYSRITLVTTFPRDEPFILTWSM